MKTKFLVSTLLVLSILAGCGTAGPASFPAATPAPPTVSPAVSAQTQAPAPADPPSFGDWDDRAIFRAGLVSAEQAVLDQLPGATVYHIDLEIRPDLLTLQGHQDVRYTNQEDKPLDEVYFRLFPNVAGGKITVSQVQVAGQAVKPTYESQASALRVPLPAALQPGAQIVIQMDFAVQVAREMAGNYGLFGYFDEVLVLDEFYPTIPVYDDDGWHAQAPAPNGDVPYFDASFYLVRVVAPVDLVLVTSGIQTSREQAGDRQTVTIAAGPARDFYLAASARYTVVSKPVGETTVNSYALAGREKGARAALQVAARALQIFSARFGGYPYTELDIAGTPMQALGVEYPGMADIVLDLYDPDAQVAGWPSQALLESVVAHEVGHQWFYNVVGNDQMNEPWLDEAVVQYITGLYYADAYGASAAQNYRASWDARWERVKRADIPVGLPAGEYAGEEYSPIVYGRGPLFIQALAKEMGQETFDTFLRDYYETYKWGIGTGAAFRRLAEEHCRCDLTDLFETWVYERR